MGFSMSDKMIYRDLRIVFKGGAQENSMAAGWCSTCYAVSSLKQRMYPSRTEANRSGRPMAGRSISETEISCWPPTFLMPIV